MKGFIEVKEKDNGIKILLQLRNILLVSEEEDGTSFIELGLSSSGESIGFYTSESYSSILSKLNKSC